MNNPTELDVSAYISVSQLKQYDTCSLRYKYYYVDNYRSIKQQIESFVGCRVHDSLEFLYKQISEGKVPSEDELLHFFYNNWETYWNEQVQIYNPERTKESYFQLGKDCLQYLYQTNFPFEKELQSIVEVEWYFQTILEHNGEKYPIHGQIDRFVITPDNVVEIHDYKTSNFLPSMHKLKKDLQPGFYQIAIEHLFPKVREVRVFWHYISAKSTLSPTLSPFSLKKTKQKIFQKIRKIQSTQKFDPYPSPVCRWCEFRSICPAFHPLPVSIDEVHGLVVKEGHSIEKQDE